MPKIKTINIYKAQKLREPEEIQSLHIKFCEEFPSPKEASYPEMGPPPPAYLDLFTKQADVLSKALINILPGGTLRRLTAMLMLHEANDTLYVGR